MRHMDEPCSIVHIVYRKEVREESITERRGITRDGITREERGE